MDDDKTSLPGDADQPIRRDGHIGDVPLVVGTMAASTFLQALFTQLGSHVGDSVDARTRGAIHRFLHRETRASLDSTADSEFRLQLPERIRLRTEQGWMINFDDRLPAGGVMQLVDICRSAPPGSEDQPGGIGTIWWSFGRWMAVLGDETDPAAPLFEWDRRRKTWEALAPASEADSPDEPGQ